MTTERIAMAVTGASGGRYALRLLEVLLQCGQWVDLVISPPGRMILATEEALSIPAKTKEAKATIAQHLGQEPNRLEVYGHEDWRAPMASGSNPPRALVVCPCSNGTLAGIASGQSRNLIERAADVVLKEHRTLLIVHRETPLSAIQLENMLRLSRAGAVIMPANPGFYQQPQTIDDLVDFMVARILDHIGVSHTLVERWGEARLATKDAKSPDGTEPREA